MTRPAVPSLTLTKPVTVLLALYNGAAFIQQQLDSIAEQGQGWRLIVSDDGSTDAGPDIVARFAEEHPGQVQFARGPGQGAAANFMAMLRGLPDDGSYAALADQDDVWLPGKLARALDQLATVPEDQPGLYCSRVVICDAALNRLSESRPVFPPSFRHALVQNLVQGNTVVLNPAAIALARQAAQLTPPVVMHDWWLYQLLTGVGGRVIQDAEPSVLYRQHGANVVGANGGLSARLASFQRMLTGDHRDWSRQTLITLEPVRHLLTIDARKALDDFAALHRAGLPGRLAAMRRGGFVRQGMVSQSALWLAAALGRI